MINKNNKYSILTGRFNLQLVKTLLINDILFFSCDLNAILHKYLQINENTTACKLNQIQFFEFILMILLLICVDMFSIIISPSNLSHCSSNLNSEKQVFNLHILLWRCAEVISICYKISGFQFIQKRKKWLMKDHLGRNKNLQIYIKFVKNEQKRNVKQMSIFQIQKRNQGMSKFKDQDLFIKNYIRDTMNLMIVMNDSANINALKQ